MRRAREAASLLPSRFLAKVRVDESTDCWIWTGYTDSDGYGRFTMDGKTHYAHRLSYAATADEGLPKWEPGGLELDHLCRVRACVNPEHLELVSGRENKLRGESLAAQRAKRTHCLRGHELSEGNLRPSAAARGVRKCLRCCRERNERSNAAIRAAHHALGLTRREYLERYGSSLPVALALIDEVQP